MKNAGANRKNNYKSFRYFFSIFSCNSAHYKWIIYFSLELLKEKELNYKFYSFNKAF